MAAGGRQRGVGSPARTCALVRMGTPVTDDARPPTGAPTEASVIPPRRRLVWTLVVVQVLIPAVLLGVRIADPAAGQLPFGWQMHTACWGNEAACR